jgi:TIR domain
LQVGDSLSQTIARGLRDSRFGITIISRAFMEKKWPQNELSALFAMEVNESDMILPVWHKIDVNEVKQFNPILADRYALNTRDGIESIARAILRRIGIWERADEAGGSVAGIWLGESGRLLLRYENGRVRGDYDWYGEKWVGAISDGTPPPVIHYRWSWNLDSSTGRGFFVDTFKHTRGSGDIRALRGGWWYEGEVSESDAAVCAVDLLHSDRISEPQIKIHRWEFVAQRLPFPLEWPGYLK